MTMNSNSLFDWYKGLIRSNIEFLKRLRLGYELLRNIPKVEVGTTPSDVVFELDKMKLLHYRPLADNLYKIPLLIVYANINKPYILDLQSDRSVIRRFLERGIDVYLIDWGIPGDEDRYLTLNDYINIYMRRAVNWILRKHGVQELSLMGYCIGGYFTSIYASLYPEQIKNLIIMAAPVDFHADAEKPYHHELLHHWTSEKYFDVDKFVDAFGNPCGDFMNMGFLWLQPVENMHLKYINLLYNIENEKFVQNFFRMEKWIFDGIPMPAEFYREYIKNGYQHNLFARGMLWVGGKHADPKRITMPLLLIVAERDHLVPPAKTLALKNLVSSNEIEIYKLPSGHIGVSVGGKAHRELWPKAVEWLMKRST